MFFRSAIFHPCLKHDVSLSSAISLPAQCKMLRPPLSQFKGGQSDDGEGDREEPEADDNLRLGPAGQMEMVMDGGTAENAFAAGVFEVADLKDDAEQLHHKHTADDKQKQFVAGDDGAVAHRSPQRQ